MTNAYPPHYNRLKTSRLYWLDMAKGFSMILVVYGHSCNEFGLINQWICSFFMALFFISAGYTWHKKDHWFKKNILNIYLPYLLWGVVGLLYAVIKAYFSSSLEDINLWKKLYRMLSGMASDNYPLWFLAAFFVSKTLYDALRAIIDKFMSNHNQHYRNLVEIIVVSIICVAGYVYTLNKPFGHSVLRFDTALVMLPFFTIGQFLPNLMELIEKKRFMLWTLLFAIIINIITDLWLNNLVSVSSNEYGNIICFFISSISGSLTVFILCKYSSSIKLLRQILAFHGRYSLTILCSHAFVLAAVSAFVLAIFPSIRNYPIVITSICLMILAPFIPMIDKGTRTLSKLTEYK